MKKSEKETKNPRRTDTRTSFHSKKRSRNNIQPAVCHAHLCLFAVRPIQPTNDRTMKVEARRGSSGATEKRNFVLAFALSVVLFCSYLPSCVAEEAANPVPPRAAAAAAALPGTAANDGGPSRRNGRNSSNNSSFVSSAVAASADTRGVDTDDDENGSDAAARRPPSNFDFATQSSLSSLSSSTTASTSWSTGSGTKATSAVAAPSLVGNDEENVVDDTKHRLGEDRPDDVVKNDDLLLDQRQGDYRSDESDKAAAAAALPGTSTSRVIEDIGAIRNSATTTSSSSAIEAGAYFSNGFGAGNGDGSSNHDVGAVPVKSKENYDMENGIHLSLPSLQVPMFHLSLQDVKEEEDSTSTVGATFKDRQEHGRQLAVLEKLSGNPTGLLECQG